MTEGWEAWEDHKRDEEGPHGIAAITPYMGDPLCTEFERLCSSGAEIMAALDWKNPSEDRMKAKISGEVLNSWRSWQKRVQLLEKVTEDEMRKMSRERGTELDDPKADDGELDDPYNLG